MEILFKVTSQKIEMLGLYFDIFSVTKKCKLHFQIRPRKKGDNFYWATVLQILQLFIVASNYTESKVSFSETYIFDDGEKKQIL